MKELNLRAIEQLAQLFNGVTWDGDLIDKPSIQLLRKHSYCDKADGWNFITEKGVRLISELQIFTP